MEVNRVYWWQHQEKMPAVSTAKIHRSVRITPKVERPKCFEDYAVELDNLDCVAPEVY